MAQKLGDRQTNWYLGRNTSYFHLQYPLPHLICVKVLPSFDCKDLTPFTCGLPYPEMIDGSGGTPNQKAERVANRIACYFFTNPDPKKGPDAYHDAVKFFTDQATATGHQCVGKADEALTSTHGPIWWRAVMSLRITSWGIANGKVSWFKDDALETSIQSWIQWHWQLSQLGEIQGGPHKWKVLLPGARWLGKPFLFPDPPPASAKDATHGERYPNDPMTDQVSNVIYQLIKTGTVAGVPWQLGKNFWNLDPCFLDRVGAALARSAVENGLKLGAHPAQAPPKLHSQLEVERYANGHLARFPCGLAGAPDASTRAWADYDNGCMSLSADGNPPAPTLKGPSQTTVVDSVLPCKLVPTTSP
ncbi:MAG TPA: hypothetical protein VF173_07375 [Thermoanaerobaculia bacterium]|nr:hypothetical protein [Thermoanaerobaculia bacterium]